MLMCGVGGVGVGLWLWVCKERGLSVSMTAVGLWASGTLVSMCQQLGRVGIQGQLLNRLWSKTCYWRDPYCVCLHVYIYNFH